jgi:hypothetical protein
MHSSELLLVTHICLLLWEAPSHARVMDSVLCLQKLLLLLLWWWLVLVGTRSSCGVWNCWRWLAHPLQAACSAAPLKVRPHAPIHAAQLVGSTPNTETSRHGANVVQLVTCS